MVCSLRWKAGVVLLAAVLFTSPVSAQFRVNPVILNNQPVLQTGGFARPMVVGAPGFAPVYNPYWGGGYFGGFMDPAYGRLAGAAELTSARAQAQVTLQQSRLLNEQALQSQIDTRKALIEQMRWEKETTPSLEEIREKNRQLSVRRFLNDPPLSEITSGDALNALMEQIRRNMLANIPGPLVPLDPVTLTHINVTTGTTSGGSAVARDTQNLKWPLVLQDPRWKDLREVINTATSTAMVEARSSGIQFETNKKLTDSINQLDKEVDNAVAELTPTEFIQARRFVKQLKESQKTLADPDASNYLTGKWTARGNTVPELVQNMQASGLRFAPARPGDEPFYRSLQTSMAAYVTSQTQLTTQASQMPVNPYQPQP